MADYVNTLLKGTPEELAALIATRYPPLADYRGTAPSQPTYPAIPLDTEDTEDKPTLAYQEGTLRAQAETPEGVPPAESPVAGPRWPEPSRPEPRRPEPRRPEPSRLEPRAYEPGPPESSRPESGRFGGRWRWPALGALAALAVLAAYLMRAWLH